MSYLFKRNEYRQVDENTVAIQITNSLHGNVEALISKSDEESAKKLYWNVFDAGTGRLYVRAYARRWMNLGKQRHVYLHRYLLGFPSSPVDHVSLDTLDNRRGNIRLATATQNQFNKASYGKIGFKGVTIAHKGSRRPYRASIRLGGKLHHLGSFGTALEAALAYNEKAKIHHGEFARLNEV